MDILDILREDQDKRLESFKGIWERNPKFFMQTPELFKIIIENDFMVFSFQMDPYLGLLVYLKTKTLNNLPPIFKVF
jgi:hypothetical protein